MIMEHLNNYGCNHAGAAAAFGVSVNGGAILQSVIVGMLVFCGTTIIKLVVSKIFKVK